MASTNKVGDERTGESSLSSLVQAGADVSVIPAAAEAKNDSFASFLAYQCDVIERGILFWDTLRQRADNLLEHERLGLPALLDFKWELLLDARAFEKPATIMRCCASPRHRVVAQATASMRKRRPS